MMKKININPKLIAFTASTLLLLPFTQVSFAKEINARTSPIIADTYQIAQQQANIEVVFVLDTTGSMSGLINAAKEKIWSIASTMASANNSPDIKMGLVAYRDRGDAYVTKVIDLSNDLDSMYSKLMDFKAQGGGDGPESVNEALFDAVHKISWSQKKNTYKVVFLIGDAPAHMDYQDDVKYPNTISIAQKKDIIINAIQSGQSRSTTRNWQRIASLGQGEYFQVENNGNAVAIATPFDKKLAILSAELDDTRLYYGDNKMKLKQRKKVAASSKIRHESSEKSLARRATYNVSKSGKRNFLGEGELIDAISNGIVKLTSIAKKELPKEMQSMSDDAMQDYVQIKAKKRQDLNKKIKRLSEERNEFLKKEVAKTGADKDSFDAKIFGAIQSQARTKGLEYKKDNARY